jgi:hypothetical protein
MMLTNGNVRMRQKILKRKCYVHHLGSDHLFGSLEVDDGDFGLGFDSVEDFRVFFQS